MVEVNSPWTAVHSAIPLQFGNFSTCYFTRYYFPLLRMEMISQMARNTATRNPISPKMGIPFKKGGILAFTIKEDPIIMAAINMDNDIRLLISSNETLNSLSP